TLTFARGLRQSPHESPDPASSLPTPPRTPLMMRLAASVLFSLFVFGLVASSYPVAEAQDKKDEKIKVEPKKEASKTDEPKKDEKKRAAKKGKKKEEPKKTEEKKDEVKKDEPKEEKKKEPFVPDTPKVELKGHTDWINAIAFVGDGKLLVSASRDRTVRIWD